MSLLDFAIGAVGGAAAGAAQGLQAQHKSRLEEQRQANLMRLQAQYKREEVDSTVDLLRSAQGGDSEAALRLTAMGQMPPPDKGTPQDRNVRAILGAEGIPEGTPEYQERYAQLMQDLLMRPTTAVTIRDTEETAFAKELGKLEGQEFISIQQASATATRNRAEIARLQEGLQGGRFTTGAFVDMRVLAAQYATLAGLDSEALGLGDAATADQMESAMKLIAANLFKEVASGTGTPRSNAMLQFIQDAGPKLSRTPEGNAIILEVLDRKSVRDNEIARLADYYRRTYRSLSPEDPDVPSFYMAAQELEENDPLISEELRQRIRTTTDNAPSAEEAFDGSLVARGGRLSSAGKVVTGTSAEAVMQQFESAGIRVGDEFVDQRPNSPTFGQVLVRNR